MVLEPYIYIYIGCSSHGETPSNIRLKNGCNQCIGKREYQKVQHSFALYRGVTHWLLTRWDVGSIFCIGIPLMYNTFQLVLQTQKSYQNSSTQQPYIEYDVMLNNDDWRHLLINLEILMYFKDQIHQQVLPVLIRFLWL